MKRKPIVLEYERKREELWSIAAVDLAEVGVALVAHAVARMSGHSAAMRVLAATGPSGCPARMCESSWAIRLRGPPRRRTKNNC